LSPAETAAKLEQRTLTNAPVETFIRQNHHDSLTNWPPSTWDLEILSMAAFYYHPQLEVARAQWAVAKGAESTARQRPNPSLTVTPGYNSTTPMASPWLPLAFVDVPIETAKKRGHRGAHAARLAEAARLNVLTVAWQIRSKLRSSLLETYAAEQREGLLQQQIEIQERISKALEQQMQAGAIAGSELLPIRIGLIKSHLDVAEAQRAHAEAWARVAEAVGVSMHALDQITLSFDSLERVGTVDETTGGDLQRAALQGRPDILGALAEYEAAQSALQLEIAKQYPDVRLQPAYQYDQGDNKWSLGIVVDLPLFHQNQGPIAEAKARREEAAAKFEALQAKVLAEIETASQVLRVTQQTTATLRSLTEAQSQRRESVAAQFKAGATDQLELLNAQSEYLAAELVQLDGHIKLQQAVGAMEDAIQRPFDFPSAAFASSRAHAR